MIAQFAKIILGILWLGLLGCAHTARIISVPEGATISVDGKEIGKSPVAYLERSGPPGAKREIKAELKGYEPLIKVESRKICPNPSNLLADSLGVGFFWGFCLRDEYIMDLKKAGE